MGASKFVNICSVLLLILQVFNLLSANTNAFPATNDSDDIGIHPIWEPNCYKGNTPYEELIPHGHNCTRYFHCKLLPVDNRYVAQPLPRFCSYGLIYNFNNCSCDWADNVQDKCFDQHNNTHVENMFKCAKAME